MPSNSASSFERSCYSADPKAGSGGGKSSRKMKPKIRSILPNLNRNFAQLIHKCILPVKLYSNSKAVFMNPVLPEDVERAITDTLLNENQDMCGTMALVAPRFHAWTKPFVFRTVVVRRRDDWTKRVNVLLLPNAIHIRTLALDLPLSQRTLSDEEQSLIRALLQASIHVKNLATTWHIWARLAHGCRALQLSTLYLIWDRVLGVVLSSLKDLRHPTLLTEITIYAPPDLANLTPFRPWGELYLPDTSRCANLVYVTYVADRTPIPTVGSLCEDIPNLRGAMFAQILLGDKEGSEEDFDDLVKEDMEVYPNFSATFVSSARQVLDEWLAKANGGPSVLQHPPPRLLETE
ncbi:hypothetical protein R3P38DRAFT_968437 [Favolaschia claudopus]|uniref:Uncharacterized protein n=1 Tax=Favolaschia claudopus TaxID=2862362 RepID=A0AAW0E783_9AGAR